MRCDEKGGRKEEKKRGDTSRRGNRKHGRRGEVRKRRTWEERRKES